MAEQGYFISDLPAVVTPASELAGALFEVEALAGPVAGAYVNKKLTAEQFVAYLAAGGPGATSITENTAAFYHAATSAQAVYGADPLTLKQALDAVAAYFLAAIAKIQAGAQAPVRPAAPTDAQVDDTGDTFSVLPNALFPALGDNEAFYPGSAGTVALTSTNAYLASGRIYLRVTTNAAPGTVGIRVAASGNRPASAFATNATAFTGTASTPPPANQLPTANAGSNTSITLPTSQVALMGSGTDLDGTVATYAWRQVTGTAAGGMPSTVQNPVVTGLTTVGTYQFGLIVTDNSGGKSAEVFTVVTVNAATTPTSYANTIYGGGAGAHEVSMGAAAADTLEYDTAMGTNNSPLVMELWLAGTQTASVPYAYYYNGLPFRYTHNNIQYTRNFTASRIDL